MLNKILQLDTFETFPCKILLRTDERDTKLKFWYIVEIELRKLLKFFPSKALFLKNILPVSSLTKPRIDFIKVDLPAPEEPNIAIISLLCISRFTPARAVTPPLYVFFAFLTDNKI